MTHPETMTRIDAACFIDGDDDEYVVEFWYVPGSILRTCYNRRTTCTTREFIATGCWEFGELMRYVEGHFSGYSI